MEIDLENIPLYSPNTDLAKRLYAYLQNVWSKKPLTMVTREQLLSVAKGVGFSREEVKSALHELSRVSDCISFWESSMRTVLYAVAPMTAEEKFKRIDDAIWFERLPIHDSK